MSEAQGNIHVLDAAYKPFPTFEEWESKTHVDTVRWDRYKAELQGRPKTSPDALRRAYEVVKRAAALDTGAIEGLYPVDRGFTFTVAFETAAWESELAKKGENVRSLFEAQLQAYDYVLDFATKAEPISEAAIRKLHEIVCGAQNTYRVITSIGFQEQSFPKGRYKVLPNHVTHTREGTTHSYAPVDVTPVEMARLVNEIRGDAFQSAHPVIQAVYAHYGLVVIHPFADGNGRVARALASAFTYRAISMPIMILSEHKNAYLDALEAADNGKYQVFVDFMLARSLDTMRLVNESVRGDRSPSVEEGVAVIGRLFVTRGGFTQEQVDRAGNQLMELIKTELTRVIAERTGGNLQGLAVQHFTRGQRIAPNSTHRLLADAQQGLTLLQLEFTTSPPALARVYRDYLIWLPVDAAGDDDIELARVLDGPGQPGNQLGLPMPTASAFTAQTDDLIPVPSGVLQIRAGLFAERVVGELLSELAQQAKKALHEHS